MKKTIDIERNAAMRGDTIELDFAYHRFFLVVIKRTPTNVHHHLVDFSVAHVGPSKIDARLKILRQFSDHFQWIIR